MCKQHRFTQQELNGSDTQPPTGWWSQNHRTGWKRLQKIIWFKLWWEREPRHDHVAPQTPPWGSLTDYPPDFFFLLCNIPFLYQDDGITLPTRKAFSTPCDLLLTIQTMWGIVSFFCCFFLLSISRLWSKIHPGADVKSNIKKVTSGHRQL